MLNSYKELIVWQKSMDLVTEVYAITEDYPKSEMYGLTNQIRRSAVSLPSNIAEGRRRGSKKDYQHFLTIAYGSGAELETQLEIAQRLKFGKNIEFNKANGLLDEIMKMLNRMLNKLRE